MDLSKVISFTKEQLKYERTGHDFYHGQRVANLATKMYLADYPNAYEDSRVVAIIKTGGYLHDTIDEKVCPNPEEVIKKIRKLLAEVDFTSLEIKDILFSIQHLSFSKNIEHR